MKCFRAFFNVSWIDLIGMVTSNGKIERSLYLQKHDEFDGATNGK